MNYLSNLLPDLSDKWIALLSRCANYTSPCTSFQMSSSEGSCSPANTPDHVCPGPTFAGQTCMTRRTETPILQALQTILQALQAILQHPLTIFQQPQSA